MMSFIISNGTISLVHNNKPYTIDQSHINYNAIIDALKTNDDIALESLLDVVMALNKYDLNNDLTIDIENNTITYKQYPLNQVLISKLLDLYKSGFNLTPLLKFIDNLYLNPSYKTINELYSFLEVGKLPITDDGHFLAYKKVNADYTSIHDGKTKNDIGTIVKMDRSMVDDDSNNTCSTGLHFCSYDYLEHFGGTTSKTVIVKINPKNVVSVPKDYNNTKGRACEYLIYSEVGKTDLLKDSPVIVAEPTSDANVPLTTSSHPILDEAPSTPYGLVSKSGTYMAGYFDGFIGNQKNPNIKSDAYIHGFADGKEIFEKLPDERKNKLSGSWVSASFQLGFFDGLNTRPLNNKNDALYVLGYEEGKNSISIVRKGCFSRYVYAQEMIAQEDARQTKQNGLLIGSKKYSCAVGPEAGPLVSTVTQEAADAYNNGFKDGYHKRGDVNRQIHIANVSYYEMGQKDGRGHKTRKKFIVG